MKKACVRIAKQAQEVWEAGMPHGASPDAQSRFMVPGRTVTWPLGLRGFSPLVFSGEFHTPRLQETLQVTGSV